MKKIKLSKKKIIELYCYKNYTDKEIGIELGCSNSVVNRFRIKNNIIRLYKDKDWLIMQRNEGLNDTEIAKLINCNPGTISKAFKKITGISNKKASYTINNNLFSGYSKEECYWAGFILADGHIELYKSYGRKVDNAKLKILLSTKDINHLKKFATFLGDENINIKTKENFVFGKIHSSSEIKISRKEICDNLINNFEILVKNKSTKEFISSKIPKYMLPHFIRGYFDGDGSIYKKNKIDTPGVTIVGSKKICEQLKEYFNMGSVTLDSNNLYRYNIYKKLDIKKFREIIYNDSTESTRLSRKYEKFNEFSYNDKRFRNS